MDSIRAVIGELVLTWFLQRCPSVQSFKNKTVLEHSARDSRRLEKFGEQNQADAKAKTRPRFSSRPTGLANARCRASRSLTRFAVYVHGFEISRLDDAEGQVVDHRIVRERRQQMAALVLQRCREILPKHRLRGEIDLRKRQCSKRFGNPPDSGETLFKIVST